LRRDVCGYVARGNPKIDVEIAEKRHFRTETSPHYRKVLIMREIIKKRSLQVSGVPFPTDLSNLRYALLRMGGVRKVEVNGKGQILVEYDLVKTKLEKIEGVIETMGFTLQSGWFSKLKSSIIRYSEQNEYDNLTAPSRPCCSNPKL